MASDDEYVAETSLRLPNPHGVSEVLWLLGMNWAPNAFDKGDVGDDFAGPGLYMWVVGPQVQADPMRSGGLYVGVGNRMKGGVGERLRNEWSWVDKEAWHAHGRAMAHTNAVVLAGPVSWRDDVDLSWLDVSTPALAEWAYPPRRWGRPWGEVLRAWLASHPAPEATAEAIAIRAGIYLGDVGFPVNSKMASAWNVDYGGPERGREDGAAWAAVKVLRAESS